MTNYTSTQTNYTVNLVNSTHRIVWKVKVQQIILSVTGSGCNIEVVYRHLQPFKDNGRHSKQDMKYRDVKCCYRQFMAVFSGHHDWAVSTIEIDDKTHLH